MKFNVDAVPEIPELHASRQNLETVLKAQYWQQLCPTLHVADAKFFRSLVPFQLAKGRLNDLKHQINHAGVAQVCIIEHRSVLTSCSSAFHASCVTIKM